MKTKASILTLVLSLSVVLAACSPSAAPTLSDPLTIVQRYYEAIEANDIQSAATFFASDVVMTDPAGMTTGKEAVTAAWQSNIEAGFTFDQSDFQADGNRVTSCFKVYQNGALIDEGCSAVTHVRNSQIVFDGLLPAENVWVVQNYLTAINSGDLEGAMRLLADDAVMTYPGGHIEGKQAIRESYQAFVKDGYRSEFSDLSESNGEVRYCYTVFFGSDQLDQGCNGLAIVEAGIVVFDGLETVP